MDRWSLQPHFASNRFKEFDRIITDAILEDDLNLLKVGDVGFRIAVDYDEVSLLAHLDRSDAIRFIKKLGPVGSRDVDRLNSSESCLHKQFDFTLHSEAGHYPKPTASRSRPRHQ